MTKWEQGWCSEHTHLPLMWPGQLSLLLVLSLALRGLSPGTPVLFPIPPEMVKEVITTDFVIVLAITYYILF